MKTCLPLFVLATVSHLVVAGVAAAVTNFEGHQTHPIELTPDGSKLLALNTPDMRLAIFTVEVDGSLTLEAEVPVGVEPVSVRARTNGEAWVVNHVSDSISIVDLTPGLERVVRTVATDDEPADVVFAGAGDTRAFVSISQRNRVDVYSATNPTSPLFQLDVDGEDPRALARNAAGTEVYAAVFHSGNQTLIISGETGATVPRSRVTDSGGPYSGGPVPPPPGYNAASQPFDTRPQTSLIVKWRDCTGSLQPEWCDDNDNSWNTLLESAPNTPIQMPDRDVAIIDADAGTPAVSGYVTSVGTLNFGVAVQPGSDRLYVANTDARNHVRFESGVGGAVSLNGHLVDTRITVAQSGAVQGFLDLNPHIDYGLPIGSIDATLSLGQPNGMAFDSTGDRLYAAALLSRKVAVLDTSTVPGSVLARIDVGEGPTGVALAESKSRLYVLNRHDNTISVVDTNLGIEVLTIALYNPEGPDITGGRTFLYDGQLTSGRGEVACATCHAFGNFDLLAWDLGDPTRTEPFDARPSQSGTGVAVECAGNPNQAGCGPFHPLKGPLTTQSLRGLQTTEPFHWRGDRENFQAFNPAFTGLLKAASSLSPTQMNAFTDFIMTVKYPPNPNRNLDDSLSPAASAAHNEYLNVNRDGGAFTCNQCHALPTGTNGRFINAGADQVQQAMKTPQLRNMYEKTGLSLHPDPLEPVPATTRNGFGFVHSGETDSLETFFSNPVFTFVPQGDLVELANMVQFMLEFPTGQPAAVGHGITFNGTNNADAQLLAELDVLLESLNQGEVDLIVKGWFGAPAIPRGFRCTSTGPSTASCQPDRLLEPPIDAAALKDLAISGQELSFRAVPVGEGLRAGVDRDLDGFWDQDEIDAGSDPANPGSTPGGSPPAVPGLGFWGALALAALLGLVPALGRRRLGLA